MSVPNNNKKEYEVVNALLSITCIEGQQIKLNWCAFKHSRTHCASLDIMTFQSNKYQGNMYYICYEFL